MAGAWSGGVAAPRMPVPEAAMNKNADPIAREHKIRPSRKILLMKAVSEALPVQHASYLHFRRRVAAPDARHHARPDFLTDYVHESRPEDPFSGGYAC